MYSKLFKRVFDILLSSVGIFVSSPLWVVFSTLIWFEDREPIYYLQDRVGKEGKIFKGIKFRSMVPDAENGLGPVQAQKNDPRETRIGRIMRKTAMDELPQLINILKGEMSFVGPRALRPKETELDNPAKMVTIFEIPGFKKRSSVRPGLTGVAQVFASRSIPLEEKFKYDLWYVDNMSFWADIKLIINSFAISIQRGWNN